MNLENWIGLRYLRTKKRNGFISFISVISVLCIALGVMTLIVVLSVMNGFQRDVRAKLFEVSPHITVGYTDPEDTRSWQNLVQMVKQNKHVIAATPVADGQALLTNAGEVKGALLQGIVPDEFLQVAQFEGLEKSHLDTLKSGEFNIILGSVLAENMAVNVGDKITVLTPQGNATPTGMVPRLKQFNVTAIVATEIYEMNNTLALVHIADAQKLFKMGDNISGVRLKLDNPQNAPEIAPTIIPNAVEQGIWVHDWSYSNRSYFEAVAVEKKMMFIIMTLISLVASVNLISLLAMTVNEKRADIAILRTLGMSPKSVMQIFLVQGGVVGFFGTVLGVILGVSVATNISSIVAFIENLSGRSMINSQVYFLNYIPSDVQSADVTMIAIISLVLSFLATIFPAWSAARTQPAEALRYE